MQSLADILGPDGPFARHFPGFASRPQQLAMADAVQQTLENHDLLVAEAGTGTGKTLAYLVPALLSGQKILISTGTKNLQDQLFLKDLPAVLETLDIPARVALLKGRANYLCIHRLERKNLNGRFKSREDVKNFNAVRNWSLHTKSGDIAELPSVSELSPLWPMVTSTTDNCLGGDCEHYEKCYVVEARRKAQAADVVVINHHLFFADIALRDEGVAELLPAADAVVFDEAHQLPEVATHFFGTHISARQLQELCTDSVAAADDEASDQLADLTRLGEHVNKDVNTFHQTLTQLPHKAALAFLQQQQNAMLEIEALKKSLQGLCDLLENMAERGKELSQCYERAIDLKQRLQKISQQQENHVHWYDVRRRNFALQMSPVNIAEIFAEFMAQMNMAWVFTSATLSVDENFDFFTSRLGLHEARCERWPSPFDYAQNSLLYVPTGLPQPNAPDYLDSLLEKIIPVIEASQGRAFLLFTSHRALQIMAEKLKERVDFPLLVQGSMSKRGLIQKFRETDHAVLLGTASFWEGVDVKGEDLSCVIIDKLPFATPGEPLLAARLDHIRQQGGNPFNDYQVPQAVIALEQGVGRLIRDEHDRGVVMIGDPRLLSKGYGKTFLRSLPPMPLTRVENDVNDFFGSEAAQ